ncbi:MAG: DUF3006 domain-containing protein [Firmicutes bacterium HGW-Firmicutes-16]|nr:MAG: DUF3006 domain-containing protein [Firmicutes bacterium HGW-Firmicutes-16]
MKIIIDRFEGEFAVVELEDRSFANLPKKLIPTGADEGTVVSINVEQEQTEKLKAGMSRLIKDLFKE